MPDAFDRREREHWQRIERGTRGSALEVMLRCFADAIGADRAVLVGTGPDGLEPPVLGAWDRWRPRVQDPWTRESMLARAVDSDHALVELNPDADGEESLSVAVAVRLNGVDLGAIRAELPPGSQVPLERLRWLAESYARVGALCLDSDLSLLEALGSSVVDALTGCLNYGGLVEALEAEIDRSRRLGLSLTCCFVDLDGFKLVNDEHGHLVGNRVLAAVGSALRTDARSYDKIGRFGGDEFIILLPETNIAEALPVAERCRSDVQAAIAGEVPIAADVSIGIAEWDGKAVAADLLETADRALGNAKRAGGGAAVAVLGEGKGRFEVMINLADGGFIPPATAAE